MNLNLYKEANNNITVPNDLVQSTLQQMQSKEGDTGRKLVVRRSSLHRRQLWRAVALVPCACLIILLLYNITLKDSIYINDGKQQMAQIELHPNLGNTDATTIKEEDYIKRMNLSDLLANIETLCPTLMHEDYTAYTLEHGDIIGDELIRKYEDGEKRLAVSISSTKNYLEGYPDYRTSDIKDQTVVLISIDQKQYMALYQTDTAYITLSFSGYEKDAFLDALEKLL